MLTSGTYSGIKSVQRGQITIGATSASQTIASVNPAKAEVRYLGGACNDAGSNSVQVEAYVYLANATTVTAVRALASAAGTTVSFEVTEWN